MKLRTIIIGSLVFFCHIHFSAEPDKEKLFVQIPADQLGLFLGKPIKIKTFGGDFQDATCGAPIAEQNFCSVYDGNKGLAISKERIHRERSKSELAKLAKNELENK